MMSTVNFARFDGVPLKSYAMFLTSTEPEELPRCGKRHPSLRAPVACPNQTNFAAMFADINSFVDPAPSPKRFKPLSPSRTCGPQAERGPSPFVSSLPQQPPAGGRAYLAPGTPPAHTTFVPRSTAEAAAYEPTFEQLYECARNQAYDRTYPRGYERAPAYNTAFQPSFQPAPQTSFQPSFHASYEPTCNTLHEGAFLPLCSADYELPYGRGQHLVRGHFHDHARSAMYDDNSTTTNNSQSHSFVPSEGSYDAPKQYVCDVLPAYHRTHTPQPAFAQATGPATQQFEYDCLPDTPEQLQSVQTAIANVLDALPTPRSTSVPGSPHLQCFTCSYAGCDKAFTNHVLLLRHEKIHSDQRPWVCDEPGCGKAYTDKSSLTKHKRKHTGERPHVCDICGRAFALVAHLTRHRMIHSGDKPHACPVDGCCKRFVRLDDLKTHIRVHTGERPYVCPFDNCRKAFTQASALARHRRTQHSALLGGGGGDDMHEDGSHNLPS